MRLRRSRAPQARLRTAPCGEQLADLVQALGALEAIGLAALVAEPLDVPRIELAQVARGARSAPQCSAARSRTQRSSASISAAPGGSVRAPVELVEDPRVAERAARDHHRVGAGLARRRARARSASRRPPETITGTRCPPRSSARASSRDERVVGPAAVELLRRARVQGDRGDAGVGDQPLGERRPPSGRPARSRSAASPSPAGRSPRPRPARPRPPAPGHRSSAAPAPVFSTFGTGQPMLRSISAGPACGGDGRRLAHHVGVGAEELDRDRALVGVDAQHLLDRAPVAVRDREARDHLRDRQPGAVALRLQAHEPVADPGERREQDPVRDLDVRDRKGDVRGGWTAARRSALGVSTGERRAADGERRSAFRSQISRRPVSVSRSSTSSIVSQNGTIAWARPPVAISVGSPPSSASIRRAIPSISPAKPKITPDWIAPRVDLPIAASGSPSSIRADPRAALGQRRQRDLDPGRDRAAEVLAVGRDGVEVDPGAEVDHDAGAAEPLVGGDRVDEPVGADLVRVVDPDRHPGLHPGADAAGSGRRSSARPSPRTGRRAAARPRTRRSRRPRRARSRSAPAGRRSARRSRRRSRRTTVRKRQCSASSSPRKAPRWVWVLPTSIARSMGRLCDRPNGA